MDRTTKKYLYKFIYSLLIYLAVIVFPCDRFFSDAIYAFLLKIILLLIIDIFLIYDTWNECHLVNRIKPIYLIFIIGAFSNYMTLFGMRFFLSEINPIILIEEIFISILIACGEEIIFRLTLLNLFKNAVKKKNNSDLLVAFLVSISFSFVHLLGIFTLDVVFLIEQILYTFVLGFILTTIMMKNDNIIYPMIGHILFNVFNDTIFYNLFSIDYDFKYYIISSIIGVSLLGLSLLLLIKDRKEEKNVTRNLDI